ncbi:MAG: hypothetical protein JOZ07_15680 [Solirubrobacterales bacterium]|nr:hypothetical protein [Solirubrobacterales bacterium]
MTDAGHTDHRRDDELGTRLAEARPTPRASFRGSLGRRLQEQDPGYGPRPDGLRLSIATYVVTGSGLLVLATLVAVGIL